MKIVDFILSIFTPKKSDVTEFCEKHYACVINDRFQWFDSKEAMLRYIDHFGKDNVIASLSMFRYDVYNLIK